MQNSKEKLLFRDLVTSCQHQCEEPAHLEKFETTAAFVFGLTSFFGQNWFAEMLQIPSPLH